MACSQDFMPNNDPTAKDELCNILYHMVKHNWHEALHKSGRTASDMMVMELEEHFEQIELLDNLKQKGSENILVDDNSDSKKLSKKNKGKTEPSTKKGGKPNAHKKAHFSGKPKYGSKCCVLCKQFGKAETTHNTKDCKRHKVVTEKEGYKRSSEYMS
eukprot:14564716-Ditylum_brightwellii.AAC.1